MTRLNLIGNGTLKEYDCKLLHVLDKKGLRKMKTFQQFSCKSTNLLESYRGLQILMV